MSNTLVVGLGNPLAGDDGVGWHVAERLARHPGLPPGAEVVHGGTDLLRLDRQLAARRHVFLVDALLDDGPAGRVLRFDDLTRLDHRSGSVHALSPVRALRLLQAVYPELRAVPMTFLCITIRDVRIQSCLSPPLDAALEAVLDEILAVVGSPAGPAPAPQDAGRA